MTTARSQLICPDITPYYHCVSRCVRRSFLCGQDEVTGQCYEHRRAWIEQRILALASMFCIDVCAYSVMSNHYHLVVHINKNKALGLKPTEVIDRWHMEHHLPPIIQRFRAGKISDKSEYKVCLTLVEQWRERLYSLSWFMKEINYQIARQANEEDQCTGRFWEGRFKSQALLDERMLLSAMAYTDLNPLRAELAETPEASEFTSLKLRWENHRSPKPVPNSLAVFSDEKTDKHQYYIPINLLDYMEMVDWAGRRMQPEKRGVIDKDQPGILQRLALNGDDCLMICSDLEQKSRLWIGSDHQLEQAKKQLGRRRMQGMKISA